MSAIHCHCLFINAIYTRRNLKVDIKKNATTIQATKLQTRRTALLKQILKFQKMQNSFMPGLHNYLEENPSKDTFHSLTLTPESIRLHLPSSFAADIRDTLCIPELASIEERLHWAEAHDALTALCHQLRCRTIVYKHKTRTVASQCKFACSRDLEKSVDLRIIHARQQYTSARNALLSLKGDGSWQSVLQELRPEDIHGLNERVLTAEEKEEYRHSRLLAGLPADPTADEDLDSIPTADIGHNPQVGEGRRQLSWIWYSVAEGELDESSVHESESF